MCAHYKWGAIYRGFAEFVDWIIIGTSSVAATSARLGKGTKRTACNTKRLGTVKLYTNPRHLHAFWIFSQFAFVSSLNTETLRHVTISENNKFQATPKKIFFLIVYRLVSVGLWKICLNGTWVHFDWQGATFHWGRLLKTEYCRNSCSSRKRNPIT